MDIKVLYIGNSKVLTNKLAKETNFLDFSVSNQTVLVDKLIDNIDLVIYEVSQGRNDLMIIKNMHIALKKRKIILFVIKQNAHNFGTDYIKCGANDVFDFDVNPSDLINRYEFIRNNYETLSITKNDNLESFKLPVWKRTFDIISSSFLLILLLPFFIVIIFLIMLGSKGNPFYPAPRVGTGYRVFGFLKFRTMYTESDNSYKQKNRFDTLLNRWNSKDEKFENYRHVELNDPRITKFGKILRRTQLDELPKLINVLKGDISIVGNKPLTLFEAEKYTTDHWAERFLAPSGITGLWRVTSRNIKTIEELKQLDVIYAKNYSFWFDLKILLKITPSQIQNSTKS